MARFPKLSALGALLLLPGTSSAVELAGRYTIVATPGSWLLELEAGGAKYAGSLTVDGAVVGVVDARGTEDEDGDYAVEGVIAGQVNAEFAFYADDDRRSYRLLMIPLTDGVADYSHATEFEAQAADTIAPNASIPEPPEPTETNLNPGLIGLWAAQVANVGSDGSLAVELYMQIREDGYLVDRGSRAMASFDGAGLDNSAQPNGEAVRWQSDGTTIYVSSDAAQWAPLARYELSGQRLLLTYYDGSRQLWYRR